MVVVAFVLLFYVFFLFCLFVFFVCGCCVSFCLVMFVCSLCFLCLFVFCLFCFGFVLFCCVLVCLFVCSLVEVAWQQHRLLDMFFHRNVPNISCQGPTLSISFFALNTVGHQVLSTTGHTYTLNFGVAVGCGRSRFWCGRSGLMWQLGVAGLGLDVAVGCGRSRFLLW